MKTVSEIETRDQIKALEERVHTLERVFLFLFGLPTGVLGIALAYWALMGLAFEGTGWAFLGETVGGFIGLTLAWLGWTCVKEVVS